MVFVKGFNDPVPVRGPDDDIVIEQNDDIARRSQITFCIVGSHGRTGANEFSDMEYRRKGQGLAFEVIFVDTQDDLDPG